MSRNRATYPPPLTIDPTSGRTMQRQIYDWIQAAVLDGRLRPGQAVPSTRGLALELDISRAPVLAAYDQLIAEGFLTALIGGGTRVSAAIPERPVPIVGETRRATGARRVSEVASILRAEPPEPWVGKGDAFRSSMPAVDHFPIATWSSLVARHARRGGAALLGYGEPMGLASLREALAAYLGAARGVRCSAEQVMIVSGSQSGLQIVARALLNPGDPVLVEDPGYAGAHKAFFMAGARMTPVPVDADGLVVGDGPAALPPARAAYVTPSHQQPMGVVMSATRRLQLLGWAAETDAWIIEDDYDSEFRFGGRPIASLQGLDTTDRVIYIGTFSKVLSPSLRLGYVVAPVDLVPALLAVRKAIDIQAPTLVQAAMADFIREGHFARHLRRMRARYMDRRNLLAEAIDARIGDRLEIVGIQAGLHLTALLPDGVDDVEIATRAAEAGLSVLPLSNCYLGEASRSGLVLGYGAPDEAMIRRGVAKLAALLEEALPR
ncbi:MAG: PLP-dependent aminotransferase family protein [Brevundimonas sp.]|nr:MAG: PLP-dependent aminotransferase family protein [Brevundimonas sp.]